MSFGHNSVGQLSLLRLVVNTSGIHIYEVYARKTSMAVLKKEQDTDDSSHMLLKSYITC